MVQNQQYPPAHVPAEAGTEAVSQAHAQAKMGAGFAAVREGGFTLITPQDSHAREWLRRNVDLEATWMGETLVVERCFMPQLADAIGNAGFRLDPNI